MAFTPVEYVFAGAFTLQVMSAAVSAMPKPTKQGWYSWLYIFSHILTSNLDHYFEKRFGIQIEQPTDQPKFDLEPGGENK